MESAAVLAERIRSVDAQLSSLHRGLGDVRSKGAKHDSELGVIHTELSNVSEDLKEIKDQMKWVLRGLFSAIAVGLMFVVAVATLLVNTL